MPNFKSDLSQEQILGRYLDDMYRDLGLNTERIENLPDQLKGIDLLVHYNEKTFSIDEKSQLHYLNKKLPTFTFELSYLKYGERRDGWLFDKSKVTDYYFLITSIHLEDGVEELSDSNQIESVTITSVNRRKLLELLLNRGLTEEQLFDFDHQIREEAHFGRNGIAGLNSYSEGLIYYTEHLSEKPINLQLRLKFLIATGVGKQIYPIGD